METKFEKEWNKYIKNHKDINKEMPESWIDHIKSICAFSTVFCHRSILRKFANFVTNTYEPGIIKPLRALEKRPWVYALFT